MNNFDKKIYHSLSNEDFFLKLLDTNNIDKENLVLYSSLELSENVLNKLSTSSNHNTLYALFLKNNLPNKTIQNLIFTKNYDIIYNILKHNELSDELLELIDFKDDDFKKKYELLELENILKEKELDQITSLEKINLEFEDLQQKYNLQKKITSFKFFVGLVIISAILTLSFLFAFQSKQIIKKQELNEKLELLEQRIDKLEKRINVLL